MIVALLIEKAVPGNNFIMPHNSARPLLISYSLNSPHFQILLLFPLETQTLLAEI